MIKKSLVFLVISLSFLFISPSYSMFCCWEEKSEDEFERTSLTYPNKQQNSQENEFKRQKVLRKEEEHKLLPEKELQYTLIHPLEVQETKFYEEKANQLDHHLSAGSMKEETTPERKIMILGDFEVKIPIHLMLFSEKNGIKTISLKDFIYIILYDDYDSALKVNEDFKEVSSKGQVLNKKTALIRGMNIFYKDIRTKAEKFKENPEELEQIIEVFQEIVNQIPESLSPVPVQFGQDMLTKRPLILIKMNKAKGALFIRGPANS